MEHLSTIETDATQVKISPGDKTLPGPGCPSTAAPVPRPRCSSTWSARNPLSGLLTRSPSGRRSAPEQTPCWLFATHSVLKGGGAKKMLQTAKTFVTKLVRYIEWIVDPLRGHQFYLIWYCYGQKRPFFWPKPPFLAMRGSRRPRWLAKVDQMVDHSWTHVGGLT